ncbi:MAG: hypothetical protein Q8N31_20830 [Reyranella sp.]|nr:hypothetical protein [Reyranella sp.]MDP3162463.1 hypothetical protein [Reyranella sp.]
MLIRRFTTALPEVELARQEATNDVQIATLLDEKGDVGLMIPPPRSAFPDRLSYLPLATEPPGTAAPDGVASRRRAR